MTEDDTFRELKRSTFSVTWLDYAESGLDVNDSQSMKMRVEKHGWTYSEFIQEWHRRIITTENILYDRR